jgi:Heterokaryon incompatibility protein Het-C
MYSKVFSIFSEGSDKISQNTLEDLNQQFTNSNISGDSSIEKVKALLSKLPSMGGASGKMQQGEQMKQNAINFDPSKYTSEQTQQEIWQVLVWRDSLMRDIESIIAGIPGLEKLVEEISEALTVCEWGFWYC